MNMTLRQKEINVWFLLFVQWSHLILIPPNTLLWYLSTVQAFKQPGGAPIFLISSRVGGTGLDLPVASRSIIVDPDWNPSNDDQIADRIYRMGQLKDVIIYRLIASETIEEHIYQAQVILILFVA